MLCRDLKDLNIFCRARYHQHRQLLNRVSMTSWDAAYPLFFDNCRVCLKPEKKRAAVLNADRIASTERTKKLEKLQRLKEKETSLKNELQVFADKGNSKDLAFHWTHMITKFPQLCRSSGTPSFARPDRWKPSKSECLDFCHRSLQNLLSSLFVKIQGARWLGLYSER